MPPRQNRLAIIMKFPNARIVQFAKIPTAGHVKTRLIPALGEQGALELHQQLLRHTWRSLNAAQLAPVELWRDQNSASSFFDDLTPPINPQHVQQGADLGERMANAVAAVLESCDVVLIVGSDCPQLDGDYLEAALQALYEGSEVVLGPASDGGYVLIGLRRAAPQVFSDIDWGSDQVLAQTRSRLQASNCRWHELPERWDVDRPEDLQRLRALELF